MQIEQNISIVDSVLIDACIFEFLIEYKTILLTVLTKDALAMRDKTALLFVLFN